MTAEELIRKAAECTICGKVHTPHRKDNYTSWAGPDGHHYQTRLYKMTGYGSQGMLNALRQLAGLPTV